MSQSDRSRHLLAQMRALCGELGPEDGTDAYLFHQKRGGQADHRKTQQLCGQVARALNLALGSATAVALQGCAVKTVVPAPDASRLQVTVAATDPAETQAALPAATAWLRSEVATAIHRKRTPSLLFIVCHHD